MRRILLCAILAVFGLGAQNTPPADGTPLLRAKLSLEMARARVLEDRYDDASSALRDASKALANYERDSPGPRAHTARNIRQEIDAFVPRIPHNRQDAVDRIDIWRGPIEKWYGARQK
jgi:hypothetical protein